MACSSTLCTPAIEERRPATTRDATLRVLDGAIHRLAEPSADFRSVLRDAEGALPAGTDERARAEIGAFLARAPQPGPEFHCSVDFLRVRARQTLMRLREVLLNEAPPPLEPAVCYADPFALDAKRVQSTDGSVDVYGFDFDTVSLQMVLIDGDGFRDVTPALTSRSHYHLNLRVGSGGARVTAKSQSLGLAWGHLIHHSIALAQPATRLCESRIETTPAGRTVSQGPAFRSENPSGPLDGTIWADAELEFSSNQLDAIVCVAAPDPALSGCTVEFFYTTHPDRVIDGVIGASTSHVSHVRGQPDREERGGWPEPVREWIFSGFEPGGSADRDVGVTARFNGIRVVSSEGEGCISPVAYLEARRAGVISPETRRALDRKLAKIDPAILRLRPRFAPSTSRRELGERSS